jgi:hypothetical protein
MTTESLVLQFNTNVDTLTKKVDNSSKSLKTWDNSAQGAIDTTNKLSTTYTKTATAVRRASDDMRGNLANTSRSFGQAGVQVQQFVGQLQGGVSPFLALSQQAADFGIVLGAPLAGAIAGISATIAGTLLPSLMDSTTALEAMAEAAEKLDKVLDTTDEGIIEFSKELLKLKNLSQDLAGVQIAKGLIDAEDLIKKSVEGIEDSLGFLNKLQLESTTEFSKGFEESGLSVEEFAKKLKANEDVGIASAKTYTKSRDALRELEKRFDLTSEQAAKLAVSIGDFNRDANPLTAQRLTSTLEELSVETRNNNDDLVEFTASFIPYIQALSTATDKINALKSAQTDLFSGGEGEIVTPTGDGENAVTQEDEDLRRRLEMSQAFFDAELTATLEHGEKMIEAERIAEEAILKDFKDFNKEKLKDAEKTQLLLIATELRANKTRANLASNITSTILNDNLSSSEKLFSVIQDTAASSIEAYGAMAAARALAELPYPANLAEAGRVGVWTAVAAAGVRSLSLGGGGSNPASGAAGGDSSSSGATPVETVAPTQPEFLPTSGATTDVSTGNSFGSFEQAQTQVPQQPQFLPTPGATTDAPTETTEQVLILKTDDGRTLGEVVYEQQTNLKRDGII